MEKIKIGNKWIGEGCPVFIIAEAGVNHNGNLSVAKELVDIAKEAGADAVKFQTFKAEDLVVRNTAKAEYQKEHSQGRTQFEMLKKLELKYQDFEILKKHCDRRKIIFLSTPHTEGAVDFLEELVPAYKIASSDLTNLPLLEKVAGKKKPILLSTGMSTLKEVGDAVRVIREKGNKKIILLHCVSSYPASIEDVNLLAIEVLQDEFGSIVGFSDHTQGLLASIVAVALGAKVIEKHFTFDKNNLLGPDHKISLHPNQLKTWVKTIRDTETSLGSAFKKPTRSEKEIVKIGRKSIVTKVDIPKNILISEEMLTIKRPGVGIQPKLLKSVIGKRTRVYIECDKPIMPNMLENFRIRNRKIA